MTKSSKDKNEDFYIGENELKELKPLIDDFKPKLNEFIYARAELVHYLAMEIIKKIKVKIPEKIKKKYHETTNNLLKSPLMRRITRDADYYEAEKIILRKKSLFLSSSDPTSVIFRILVDLSGLLIFLTDLATLSENERISYNDKKSRVANIKKAKRYLEKSFSRLNEFPVNQLVIRSEIEKLTTLEKQLEEKIIHTQDRYFYRDLMVELILKYIHLVYKKNQIIPYRAAKITYFMTRIIFKNENEERINHLLKRAIKIKSEINSKKSNHIDAYFISAAMSYSFFTDIHTIRSVHKIQI